MLKDTLSKSSVLIIKIFNNIFIYIGIIFVVSVGAAYLLLNSQAKGVLIEQMLHREQLATRAGAASIGTFFNLYIRAFNSLSTRSEIINFGPDTQQALEVFITNWKDTPISGVILLDINGIVKFNANRNMAPSIGISLADRDYFTKAKAIKKGDVFVSSPVISRLGASKDKFIITISTPIFNHDGNLNGVLTSSIILDEFTASFINPIKITDKSLVYLLNENGDVLGTNQEGIFGVNFLDELSKNPITGSTIFLKDLKKVLTSREEGKLEVAYPSDAKLEIPKPMLLAYSPLNVGNNHFMLAISTPTDDALIYMFPIYIRSAIIIAGASFILLLMGIRIAKLIGYKEGLEAEQKT